jgi:undecaprenyl-diphosphatase
MLEIIEVFKNADKSLFFTLNGLHNAYFDNFMFLYSDKFIWIPFYLAVIYRIIKLSGRKSLWVILSLIIALTIADLVSSALIKELVQRLRPSRDESINDLVHIVNGYRGGKYGFVSSHAANAMGFAVLTSLLFKNRIFSISVFFWALITGYSRIYLGVHYPGDIIGGFIVGIFAGLLCFNLLKFFNKENTELKLSSPDIPFYVLLLNVAVIFVYGFIG